MDTFIQLISNMGFPIACCVAMFYMLKQEADSHKEEMKQMAEAINNNTKAIDKLIERLE